MPLLDQAAKLATRKMPKVITPKAHAMIDYAVAASFFAVGAFLWRRNKRAAIGALACGAAETVTALCTDYPGGVTKQLSLGTHRTIDFTLSGVITSIPGLLHFADQPEAHLFRTQGLVIAAVAGLTDFTGNSEIGESEKLGRRSA